MNIAEQRPQVHFGEAGRKVVVGCLRQFLPIENFREIAIRQENLFLGALKVTLGEFRLDQQIRQLQINFRAIKSPIG